MFDEREAIQGDGPDVTTLPKQSTDAIKALNTLQVSRSLLVTNSQAFQARVT